VFIVK